MNYDQVKERQKIGNLFSFICPGLGLIYHSKWFLGIVHLVVHLITVFWVVIRFIRELLGYYLDGIGILIYFAIVILFINWAFSMANTNGAAVREN